MAVKKRSYLALDIGGTKTAVALYRADDLSFTPILQKRYESSAHDAVDEIIRDFISENDIEPELVCLGIAGVVGDSQARVTNLPWVIDKKEIERLGFSLVCMINDLTATAAALPLLNESDLCRLQEGGREDAGVKAVLAPGTGLGEGFLIDDGDIFFPRGTEGGHTDFGPVDKEQRDLLTWLSAETGGIVNYEKVCAGPAIGTLFDFFLAQGVHADQGVRARASQATDRTPVIVEAALDGSCELCRRVLELFLALLGREAANLVLKTYATGGLFLGGGILPRLVGRTSFAPFLRAFHLPGTMNDLLDSVPVNLIVRPDVALFGVASYGRRLFMRRGLID